MAWALALSDDKTESVAPGEPRGPPPATRRSKAGLTARTPRRRCAGNPPLRLAPAAHQQGVGERLASPPRLLGSQPSRTPLGRGQTGAVSYQGLAARAAPGIDEILAPPEAQQGGPEPELVSPGVVSPPERGSLARGPRPARFAVGVPPLSPPAPTAEGCASAQGPAPITFGRMLRSEADVVDTLAGRAVTLEELYAACEEAGVTGRDSGRTPIPGHGSDTVWRRRVRNRLQALKASGRAERVGDATWVIDGSRAAPQRVLLVICGEPSGISLALAKATDLLAMGEGFDMLLTDPPYGLDVQSETDWVRDRSERVYRRNNAQVIGGYVDVPSAQYGEFTEEWVLAAKAALRPGGYLVVITGPQAAARVQVAAEDAGLEYLNTIVVTRPFALRTTRRYSHAHWAVTVCVAGGIGHPRRYFAVPGDLPRAASGAPYPRSVWNDVPKYERREALRYPAGGLSPVMVRRLLESFTPGPEVGADPWSASVVDPFCGGGTVPVVCYETRRRLLAGDVNPEALRFTMARIAAEHTPAAVGPAVGLERPHLGAR